MLYPSRCKFVLVCAVLCSLNANAAIESDEVSVTDLPTDARHAHLGVSTSFRVTGGKFDAYGDYASYPDGSSVWSLMTRVNVGYRVTRHWEVGASVGINDLQARFPSGTTSNLSFGSPSFSARYHLTGWWAHPVVHVGMSLPFKLGSPVITGDPGKDTALLGDSSGSDGVPGSGGLSARAGVGVSRAFGKVRLALDTTFVLPFAMQSEASPGNPSSLIRKGYQFQISEGAALLLGRWGFDLTFRQAWTADAFSDGVETLGSATRFYSTGLGLTYSPSRSWRVLARFDTPYPFYAYLVNQPYSPSVSMGVAYSAL